MQMDYSSVWDKCLFTIRQHVNNQSFKTWFEPIRPVNLRETSLTIQVPNRFFYEWLEEHYVGLLKMTIRKELGENAQLLYQIVNGSREAKGRMNRQEQTGTVARSPQQEPPRQGYAPGQVDTGNIKNPFIIPGIKKPKIDPQLNDKYTFNTFIEGDCNQLARSAGLAIADRPGKNSFNPLIIYGDVGLGKTHLAQAIGHRVLELHEGKSVLYVATDKFTQQIIQSIKNNAVNDLINFYQFVDVLIVDDIQFLGGKERSQEEFFHTVNELLDLQSQVVLTSDRPASEIKNIEPRLISRFECGLTVELQPPGMETRLAILRSKMEDWDVRLDDEILNMLAERIQSNVRRLEGGLVRIATYASLGTAQVTIERCEFLLKDILREEGQKRVNIDSIQKAVTDYFDLRISDMTSRRRPSNIAFPRQIAMYLSRKMTPCSLVEIGDAFGGRDHGTVIYACHKVKQRIESESQVRDAVDILMTVLKRK